MKWSDIEDELLAKVYPDMGEACVIHFPGRTKKGVASRANVLQIKKAGRKQPTTHHRTKAPRVSIKSADDEPLMLEPSHRRLAESCYGFIRTGPVPSVFHLAQRVSAIGGSTP